MKKLIVLITGLVISHIIVAQLVRDRIVTRPAASATQNIILYEHANYQGQSKTLTQGVYVLNDFNDKLSSIKVPRGMVVVIYEHAVATGGSGSFVDLLEDCPDMNTYSFNDKTSYISIFTVEKSSGYVWVRNRNVNNQSVPGHWERKRASGVMPDNAPPAVVFAIYGTDDIANAPIATQAEINEFDDIVANQLGIAVLGGETTRPFYYHHNKPGEEVYKYNKIIDPARLPGGFFNWASEKLGRAGIIIKPFEVITDLAGDIKDFIFGSSSTKMEMDCWYPVSEFRQTFCGKVTKDASICTQDYLHTQVTVDKDVCYHVSPFEKFRPMLTNRWTGETSTDIEGEVKSKNLTNLNTQTGKNTETTTPRNPMLMEIKKDENVCLYGPWMGDILDINLKVPIPLTDSKIELGNIDLRKNNEIHPVNQIWRKKDKEIHLIAIADGTGYFQKTGNGEVAASGLNQKMRFYIAFLLPGGIRTVMNSKMIEYDMNGVGFDFTDNPISDIQPETIMLKQQGDIKVKLNVHSFVRLQKTFGVSFEKIRKRDNGSVQGYIVVETERITKQGGSINIFAKDVTKDNSPVGPTGTMPVRVMQ